MKIRVSNSLFGDSEWVDAVLNLSMTTAINSAICAAQDGAQRKRDSLPRYKAVFRVGF